MLQTKREQTIEPSGELSPETYYPVVDQDGVITDEQDIIRLDPSGTRRLLRMSVIGMGCDPAIVARNSLPETLLCTIIGHVKKTALVPNPRVGQANQPPDFLAIMGDFEGVNNQTTTMKYGQQFVSNVLYLPGKMNDWVAEKLAESHGDARKKPGEMRDMAISMQLFAEQAKNLVGYTYVVRPLSEIDRADPLAALRTQTYRFLQAEERIKKLAAPRADE